MAAVRIPLNAKAKLRRREREPLEPKLSSSLMLRRIFAPAAWRCFPALTVEEGRSSELPRRAMSSPDVVVVVVDVYMVVDRDVVEAGSGMNSAGGAARWCESEDGGRVGAEGTAGLEGVEPEKRCAVSYCPGVDRGAAIVDGDGEPVGACGVCACDDAEPDAESGGERTAVCNTKRSLPLATLNRRKQSRTCPRLSIWLRTLLANLVHDVDLAISIRVLLPRGPTFHLQK